MEDEDIVIYNDYVYIYICKIPHIEILVGGSTILKNNDKYERQWEGLSHALWKAKNG